MPDDSHATEEVNHGHKEHWTHTLLHPFTALNSHQITTLACSAVAAFVGVYLTDEVTSTFTDVFYTGPLSPGQLSGFFFCYFSAILALALRYHRNPFNEEFLTIATAAAEFGGYMFLFFMCDRTTLVPRKAKRHDMDLFWILWGFLVVAALFTLRKAKAPAHHPPATSSVAAPPPTAASIEEGSVQPHQQQQAAEKATAPLVATPSPTSHDSGIFHVKHLQRDQTEEWKGWMQMMFLWYHYFNATEIYNVIRLYIAAYVWMTGFGNFSYYYIKKDFCMNRFVAMQWRLNFMVTWTCAILGNEYMLYYICPLHTLFTLFIYFGLGINYPLNYTKWGLVAKFAILFVIAFVMWDIKGVFSFLWRPFTLLVQYHDPYKPSRPILSEWEFRTFLDHFVWIVGMFMACNHPRFDAWLEKLDSLPTARSNAIKGAVVAAVGVVGYWYVSAILLLPKKEYNAIHPYTSFIPIVLFIILRNIFTIARQYHLHLFEFLGKTTLETYIAQFHIWMATTGINGSPKKLLSIFPEDWFITNFIVLSVFFFFVSYRLFQCTNAIKPILVPSKATDDVVKRNVVVGVALVMTVYVLCAVMAMVQGHYIYAPFSDIKSPTS